LSLGRPLSRRGLFALSAGAAAFATTTHAAAGSAAPAFLQARLLAKVSGFDRNFAARAGRVARVLVLKKEGDAESARFADAVAKELVAIEHVGGVTAHVSVDSFTTASAARERCRRDAVAVVHFGVALDVELGSVAKAFEGADVLTVGASTVSAERGAVVAFAVEEARPRVAIHVGQARRQNVSFSPELLRLARIVG